MEKEIISVFCICDEITQVLKIVEDPQVKMTNSEIMTTALVSMLVKGLKLLLVRSLLFFQRKFMLLPLMDLS
ncbi:hypothetical protein [Candidatus Uabimicrobium sp. HlEnr_7]|uniref:hypothetical protein n=1 Tax=Candidatus Uabimicrobium helgolandensis TaxID=3095367 RepID=UPI0035566D5E